MRAKPFRIPVVFLWLLLAACANIVPPSGGPKDVTPPKLLRVEPADSQLNIRPKEIVLQFDEYLNLTDANAQVQISPMLQLPLTTTLVSKKVRVVIPDTLLQAQTSYQISFGTAIRDLHENNIYNGKPYIFSTGSYFDSLKLSGRIWNAHSGKPDTGAQVLLYDAQSGDSAILRKKPLYVQHTDGSGMFRFEGLPASAFRIYALHDANGNLTFDGSNEWIGFADSLVYASQADSGKLELYTFPEEVSEDTSSSARLGSREVAAEELPRVKAGEYVVTVDTANKTKRTFDITRPVSILLGRQLSGTLNAGRIFLSIDSGGSTVEMPFQITRDTSGLRYELHTVWREDALYTLRLQKGFAVDSNGNDLKPGRYSFHTKRGEDYGSLKLHMPTRYSGDQFILQVANEHDTIYQQPLRDTIVSLLRVAPGNYSFRIIEDRNRNGRWDAGTLFPPKQPERVRPYSQIVLLKPGWEQEIDFDPDKEGR
jgi:uncharacterized protein (DUF2141 family)